MNLTEKPALPCTSYNVMTPDLLKKFTFFRFDGLQIVQFLLLYTSFVYEPSAQIIESPTILRVYGNLRT